MGWVCIREYAREQDLDFGYWALNGTQGPGYNRTAGAEETFGLLDSTWSQAAAPEHLAQIQELIPATLNP